MLEDMYKVMNRISEIQKRFSGNTRQSSTLEQSKNFDDTLNASIDAKAGNENKNIITEPQIKELAKNYAVKKGLPPQLVDAVIKVESGYNPKAVSPKGALGLMQLMPDILKSMGVSDAFDAEDNINAGVSLLKTLMDKYGWDVKKSLAAYNAGEGAVDKNNGIPPIKETREYVQKVINAYIENIK